MDGCEQVIAALTAAYIQGRLTKEEFDFRVGQALAMYAELDALTADIPAAAPALIAPAATVSPVTAHAELARDTANKKMIRQGTGAIAGLTFVLVAGGVMPYSPVLGLIVGAVLTCLMAVLRACPETGLVADGRICFRAHGGPVWTLWRADPMIAMCEDRRAHRVRATSGYVAGAVPVLSRRAQP